jgi:PAS domain-containing protein
LAASLEQSPDGILITNEHDQSITNNRRFSELWNIPQEMLITGLDDKAIAAAATLVAEPEEFVTTIEHIMADRTERTHDEIRFADGRFLERRTAPLSHPEGRYLGRIWLFRDITARKQAQDALAFSHVLLTAALEHSPDGIMITDAQDRGIVSNPLFVKLWDLPDAMIKTGLNEGGIAARAAQLKDPEGFAARVRHIYAHRDERTQEDLEFKNGRFFVRTTAPLSDSGGGYLGRIWVWREVTARRQAEQALAFSNTLLTAAMQSSPEGMLVVDAQGHVRAVNDRLLEIIKAPPELAHAGDHELLLDHFTALVEDPEQFLDRVRYLYAHPEEQPHDRIAVKDGRILDRHTASLYDDQHQYLARIWFFRDITKRKRAQQALTFSNSVLTAAMNSSPYGMLVIGQAAQIISYNDRFMEIFKIQPQLVAAGQNEQVLAHVTALMKDSERFLQRVRQNYANPEERSYDEFELKDGRMIDRRAAPLYDQQRRYLGLICYFRDLSEPVGADPQGLTSAADTDGLADRLHRSQVADEAREALRNRAKPPATEG